MSTKPEQKRKLDTAIMINMLEKMYMIRAFEEKAEELYTLGKIHGTMHLSIGMEASAVGSVFTLNPDDLIFKHAPRSRALYCQGRRYEPYDGRIYG